MIPDAVIDEIRARVDIVAVIGRHMELKKSGRTWKGCCVFHGERTPSFHVYPEDKHFKCYGCGEYGDVFKFLQKVQGKEFPEIVRGLAAEVGVTVPEREEDSAEQRRRRQERTEILAACDAAARYFTARLGSRFGEEARAYLAARGISDETAKVFRLGVASSAWDDLVSRLADKGVSEGSLERAGLVARRDGGDRYDRFRGRLMFPIAGLDGEAIGFGGRVLPGASDRLAKYINSPESSAYKKSRVLYAIDLAREHIRRTRSVVLVEGYFDVIGLYQAGLKNAVAVCGTALTPEHVELLGRLDCRMVTFLFDGDAAGVAAASKAAQAILPSGLSARVALLDGAGAKTDPDEFARTHGLAAVEALVAGAMPLTEFLIDRAVRAHCGADPAEASFEQRVAAFAQLKPFLDMAPAGVPRSVFLDRIARRVGIDPAAIAETRPAATATSTPERQPSRPARRPSSNVPSVLGTPALDALALLASFPTLVEAAREENFLTVYAGHELEPLARELTDGALDPDRLIERLEPLVTTHALNRVKKLLGGARPEPDAADREFRKATVEAKIEQLGLEIDRLSAAIVVAGRPIPDDLRNAMIVAARRRADLEKRRDGRRPG